jgi:hypothetical protein
MGEVALEQSHGTECVCFDRSLYAVYLLSTKLTCQVTASRIVTHIAEAGTSLQTTRPLQLTQTQARRTPHTHRLGSVSPRASQSMSGS